MVKTTLKHRSQIAAKQQAKREHPNFYAVAVRYTENGVKKKDVCCNEH